MGWFTNLFKKQNENPGNTKYAEVMNGYTPIFSQFGNNIYASDVVQQAISCIVQEMKKLKPTHIKDNGTDVISINSDIQTILNRPNPLMTTSDFLERITWMLFLNYNAFIIPTYYEWVDDKGKYKYAVISNQGNKVENKMNQILFNTLLDVERVDKFVVVKTLSGSGSAAGEAIDTLNFTNVAGTIAGDNTIFILSRTDEDAQKIVDSLKVFLS